MNRVHFSDRISWWELFPCAIRHRGVVHLHIFVSETVDKVVISLVLSGANQEIAEAALEEDEP